MAELNESQEARTSTDPNRGVALLELTARTTGEVDAAEALHEALAAIAELDDIRAVALRIIVTDVPGETDSGQPPLHRKSRGVARHLAAVPQPVVVGLLGRTVNEALEVALSADIRICDSRTTFAITRVSEGRLPSGGGTQRLPRIVGPGLAADMLLTGRILTAAEALRSGLVTEVVADADQLDARLAEVAAGIASHGALASRCTKEAVIRGADMPLEHAVRLEADLSILLHTDPERSEGLAAFREKRPPRFGAGSTDGG